MKKYTILLLCIFVVAECNKSCSSNKELITELYEVNNQSDFKLCVTYQQKKLHDTTIVWPKFKSYISSEVYRGEIKDKGEHFLDDLENFNININDSLKITKDYLKRANWTFYSPKRDGYFGIDYISSYYSFILENKDVEKIK